MASRLTTATRRSRYGDLSMNRSAPRAPETPPSVDRKTIV
jgi:hypothetical protein